MGHSWHHMMPILYQKCRRRWVEEEMSVLVVSAVTLQIMGVHLHLCCSMWKSLQAPDFYGWWKDAAPAEWVTDGTTACVLLPPPLLLVSQSMKPPETAELPRLLSRFAKFINWKVAGQTANARCFTTRMTLLKDSLLGFLQIKTQFEPPIIILTLFKTSVLWVFLQRKKAVEETWSSAVSPPAVLTLAVP